MGTWKYRKQEPAHIRGICVACGENPQKTKPNGKFRSLCSGCDDRIHSPAARKRWMAKRDTKEKRPYLLLYKKLDHCEACGFVAKDSVQLDVDHIDGDKANTAANNFQTLCANCHRLKTKINKDWTKK